MENLETKCTKILKRSWKNEIKLQKLIIKSTKKQAQLYYNNYLKENGYFEALQKIENAKIELKNLL